MLNRIVALTTLSHQDLFHSRKRVNGVGFHRRALTQQQEPAVYLDLTVQRAPRGVVYTNQGLVELGAYEINKIRRPTCVAFYEWTPVSGIPQPQDKSKGPRYDRMKLAHEYQLLLDSGELG